MASERRASAILDGADYAPPVAPGRTDRVSLVRWRNGPDDPSPLLTTTATGDVRTLVAVWPTDAAGRLLPGEIEAVTVSWWTIPRAWFPRLAALHRLWHLGRHDVLIDHVSVAPCPDSMPRAVRTGAHPCAATIDRAVRELDTERVAA